MPHISDSNNELLTTLISSMM